MANYDTKTIRSGGINKMLGGRQIMDIKEMVQ
jgi:hypothetical protein